VEHLDGKLGKINMRWLEQTVGSVVMEKVPAPAAPDAENVGVRGGVEIRAA
jgi:hypothetical protein